MNNRSLSHKFLKEEGYREEGRTESHTQAQIKWCFKMPRTQEEFQITVQLDVAFVYGEKNKRVLV